MGLAGGSLGFSEGGVGSQITIIQRDSDGGADFAAAKWSKFTILTISALCTTPHPPAVTRKQRITETESPYQVRKPASLPHISLLPCGCLS